MIQSINETVSIIATCKNTGAHSLVPKVMEWKGRTYHFTRLGFRHPTQKGKRMLHVFDMADETHSYRLEFDAESLLWELKTISDGLPS